MACTNIYQNLKTEMVKSFVSEFEYNDSNSIFLGVGRSISWNRDITKENSTFSLESIPGYIPPITDEGAENTFLGLPFIENDSEVPISLDTDKQKSEYLRSNIFIKNIAPTDISFLIPKYVWETGRIYQAYRNYEDLFEDGFEKVFYVYNENNRCVYKCLDNNYGAASTEEPTETASFDAKTLSDGYTWKLMYTLTEDQEFLFTINGIDKFTGNLMPVNNTNTYNFDNLGNIEFVEIDETFKNNITYDDKCVFSNEACGLFRDATAGSFVVDVFDCGPLSNHTTSSGYLTDYVFNVYEGPGKGQRRIITNSQLIYGGDNSECNKYIRLTLKNSLDIGLSAFSEGSTASIFNIEPQIKVFGDGKAFDPTSSLNSGLASAEFRATFSENNAGVETLNYIEVIDQGKDYSSAKALFVSGITSYFPGQSGNVLEESILNYQLNYENFLNPIISPYFGHGSNLLSELGSSSVVFKTFLIGNENQTLNATNDFRQIALLKNPLLRTPIVQMRFKESGTGGISVGDTIFKNSDNSTTAKVIQVFNFKNSDNTSRGIEIMTSDISGSFDPGDQILKSGGTTLTIDDSQDIFDGYKEFTIAGTENKNILNLTLSGYETATNEEKQFLQGRNLLMGIGTDASGVDKRSFYHSNAIGTIRSVTSLSSNRIVVGLENVKGQFNIGEKIAIIRKPVAESEVFGILPITSLAVSSFSFDRSSLNKTYTTTTKVTVQSALSKPFSNITFVQDQVIYSFETNDIPTNKLAERVVSYGHLFDFSILDRDQAILEVFGGVDNLEVGQYIPYYYEGQLSFALINSIEKPKIDYNSGEVLFVQNLFPIERKSSDREELNVVLGI